MRRDVWTTMFVVPAVTGEKVEWILGELREYSRSCEIEPCLRIIVSSIEVVQ